ncbi:MAG: potassium transporter TrkA [Chloroflexi bacterium]|nr:potassium transporter TrkA [Chloroflexota bacterium]MCI0576933.1 potassium transporter TrkA [Chloroflexota bacterium]MCI0646919.1 potassium transporter TrkA [Chloroflexota bacterium]MCI0731317.1 potassium transporter TrkA [Chloroflexota bacterium]
MRKITFRDRLRYQFDNTMSRGPAGLIVWLFIISLVMLVVISFFVRITRIDPEQRGFLDLVWAGLMRTLDAGTMGGDTGNWPFLLTMLVVTMAGIFLVSTLIGILTTSLEERLEQLRKGHSFVAEENHTVILGWSSQIFTIISELVIANANQPRSCIAVLAEKDKVEMEDEIEARVSDTGRTRVVCRSGSPMDPTDLEIINPHAARSIIILPPESENPDANVIKSILALTNNPNRRPEPYHIVAVIHEPKNMEVGRLAGGDEVQLVLAGDLIARIAAQACRQSGLSVVYTELLDFGGDEIYFQEEPGLLGKSFGEALLAYEDSAIIGLALKGDQVQLNPPMETVIQTGDAVIAVSADDDTVRLSGRSDYGIDAGAIREAAGGELPRERTLILGWNERIFTLVGELDNYVGPGSEVTVVAEASLLSPNGHSSPEEIERQPYRNQAVVYRPGDTTDPQTLNDLAVQTYDHIIVLGYSDSLDPQETDARTLVTLLHLRHIATQHNQPFSIVSEMVDVRNRELAEATRADDFIVSDKLVSLMLSQISENKRLTPVFQDLFDPEGSELYLKPAGDYVQLNKPVNFYTIVEAARRRGQVAIGYRLRAQAYDPANSYGVRVNPPKSQSVTFGEEDRIIVLAED